MPGPKPRHGAHTLARIEKCPCELCEAYRERGRERARQWATDHPERMRELVRRWAEDHPERVREHRRRSKERKRKPSRPTSP